MLKGKSVVQVKYLTYTVLLAVLVLSSCVQNIPEPERKSVPEFIDVKYDFGTFLENRYAVLSATLSTDYGIKEAGFMIGYNEASLSFRKAEIQDLSLSIVLNFLEYDTDYCFYAKASNGMNEIRTRLIRFRTPKKGEPFVPADGGSGSDDGGGSGTGGSDDGSGSGSGGSDGGNENNGGGSEGGDGGGNDGGGSGGDTGGGSGDGTGGSTGGGTEGGNTNPEPEPPTPVMPPEGVAITVSDDIFLNYVLGLCDSDNDGAILPAEAATVQSIEVCTDNIRTLDGIQYFTSVKSLSVDGTVWNGKLTALSLEYNGVLERLSCRYNHITAIKLPASLTELDMRFNNVTQPDFSPLKNLKKLDCFGNGIVNLNLKPLKSLEELVCGMNSFQTLDVSDNLNLKLLDLSDSPYLKTVYVARGQKIQTIIAENSIEFKYKD